MRSLNDERTGSRSTLLQLEDVLKLGQFQLRMGRKVVGKTSFGLRKIISTQGRRLKTKKV